MLAATTTFAIRIIITTTITTTTETETKGTEEEEEVTESSEGTTDEMTDYAMTGGRTAAATDGQCPLPPTTLTYLTTRASSPSTYTNCFLYHHCTAVTATGTETETVATKEIGRGMCHSSVTY